VHFNWTELAGTYTYLHRYEEARDSYGQARKLDPDNFWGKSGLSSLELQESGNVETAVQLTIGAQHTSEWDFLGAYMDARIFAGRFDEALEVARNIPDKLEIQRNVITLREDWAAQILYFMGRVDEARDAASAAQFRLKGLRARGVQGYAIDLAEAMMSAIRGGTKEDVVARVQKSIASRPEDKVEVLRFKLAYARIYAIAGLTSEAIEMLEPLFLPPSETSIYMVDLDPAFDGIRDDPAFITMMERHR
jgi:tetratricopeptide (TPR) repeat protein